MLARHESIVGGAGEARRPSQGAEALAQEAHGDSEGGGEEEMGEKN